MNWLWLEFRKLPRSSKIAISFLLTFFLITVLAQGGLIATDYNKMQETLSFADPSSSYWFGNDIFGRSILARGLHGGFTALTVGIVSALISTIIGSVLGLVAGFYEGIVDDVIVGLVAILDSIPYILLLTAIAFVFGQGLTNVYISLGLTSWVVLCRLLRTECRKQKNTDYALAARALGMSDQRILFSHILPNVLPLIVTQFVIVFIFAIKAEVILTYLGLGVEPGYPSWGYMLDEARQELANGFWWNFICATTMMASVVFALHTLLSNKKAPKRNHPIFFKSKIQKKLKIKLSI